MVLNLESIDKLHNRNPWWNRAKTSLLALRRWNRGLEIRLGLLSEYPTLESVDWKGYPGKFSDSSSVNQPRYYASVCTTVTVCIWGRLSSAAYPQPGHKSYKMVSKNWLFYRVLLYLLPLWCSFVLLIAEKPKLIIRLQIGRENGTRITLSPGDYIRYHRNGPCMARVNGIFLHYLPQNPERVFLCITSIKNESLTTDSVLELPIYGINTSRNEVIGLPAITGEKLYMIPVSINDRCGSLGKDIRLGGEKVIHCTWDVEFFWDASLYVPWVILIVNRFEAQNL